MKNDKMPKIIPKVLHDFFANVRNVHREGERWRKKNKNKHV